MPKDAYVKYSVKRISEEGDELCTTGEQLLPADKTIALDTLTIADGEKEFYYIEWECDGVKGKNHFVTNIIDIDYKKYMYALEKCGMNEFEGF